MKRLKNKKIVLGVLTMAMALLMSGIFVSKTVAVEAPPAAATIASAGISGYLILELGTKILIFTAGLVDFAVRFGNDILNLPAVTSGWEIILSLTNLGFVLGIIVIAFATILRMESYGMKQILWKLVVAALLVNFSLVIAGSFVSISNTVGNVFHDAALGDGGENLSNALANAMNPQKPGEVKSTIDMIKQYAMGFVPFSEANINYFANIIFIIVFTFLTILAFITLFIMLFIRAIILAFLFILSPLVWLLWIFPATSQYWKQWWQQFIRWNFFAPAVYFFIYLAVMTAAGIQDKTLTSIEKASQTGSAAAVFNEGGYMSDIFTHAVNLFVVLGLLYGGIYVANKFGIAGGSIGVKLAQGAGKGVGAWAGRKGKQYGTGWLNKKRGEPGAEKSYADRISAWSAKSKFAKYAVLPGLAARGIAKFSAAGGENLVKDAKGAASKRSLNENIAMLGYADAPNRQGILQHLQEKDLLHEVPDISKYISKGHKAEAARFGQGVGYNNIEKSLGMNVKMKETFDEFGKDSKQFYDAGKEFFSKFSEKDWAKPQYNKIYDKKPKHGVSEELHSARQEVIAYAIGEINPGQLAKLMPKFKGEAFDNYEEIIKKEIAKMKKINPKKAEKIENSFNKALIRRELGIEWEPTEATKEAAESKEEKKEEKK